MPTKHKEGLKIMEMKLGNIPQRNLKNRESMYKMANLMGKMLNVKSQIFAKKVNRNVQGVPQ